MNQFVTLDFPLVGRPPPFHPSAPPPAPRPTLPAVTDLTPLRGRRVLAVFDEDNLRISLRTRHTARLSYRTLTARLAETAAAVTAWAVYSEPAGDTSRAEYLTSRGWKVMPVPREVVRTAAGPEVKGNVDLDLCFLTAYLARTGHYDAVLVGSSDGDLCVACARGLRRVPRRPRVVTLSVPGCTSRRLTDRADLFDANIPIGRDVVRPDGG